MINDEFKIIGKTLDEARKILTENNIRYRLACIDGKHQMMTCDFNIERINLETDINIVVNYTKG